jgi:hypothetical protein
MKRWKLSTLETFWYYLVVICTFGFWYTIKMVIKKAMSEETANQ